MLAAILGPAVSFASEPLASKAPVGQTDTTEADAVS